MSAPDVKDVRAELVRRLADVQSRIAQAAFSCQRSPNSITLVAVSKTHTTDDVQALLAAGQSVFGENRVQEAVAKFSSLRDEHRCNLHLIGRLQTNKIFEAVSIADMIETLDRQPIADAIAHAADRIGRLPNLLIQVNVGDEPQKSGVSCSVADAFIEATHRRFGRALQGLMCIPPVGVDPTAHFQWLARCAVRHNLPTLSMGMSKDFELAIACGATIVRIGGAIFGRRLQTDAPRA